MKKILLRSFILLTFLCITTIFIFYSFKESTLTFIVPIVVGILGTVFVAYLLIVETIVGHKRYHYNDDILLIKRKGKTLFQIEKEDVKALTLVYDVDTDELYLISFKHCDRKHYIVVNSNNSNDILSFIEGIDYKTKRSYWYYLIYLMEIFLV